MTFEQILLLYIYQHKKISINLFGTIELEQQIPDPEILKKDKNLPVEGLKFTFDPHVVTDKAFIAFYAEEKGRILPLSASDIDMQLHMARQIVNIGNPYEIPGVGKIVKQNNGHLTMVPGYYIIPPASGSGRPPVLRERVQTPVIPRNSGDSAARDKSVNPKTGQLVIIGGIALFVILLVWVIIQFLLPALSKKSDVEVTTTVEPVEMPAADTVLRDSTIHVPADSVALPVDSLALLSWKAYIARSFDKKIAEARVEKYKSYGHNASMEMVDSTNFQIYLTIQSSLKDTARQKDSLSRFFATKVRIVRIP